MLQKLTIFLILLLIVTLSNVSAAGLEIAAGGWRQSINGNLAYSETSAPTDIDLADDLDFDHENSVFGRAKIDMPLLLPNIYLIAAPMEFQGEGIKEGVLNFGDYTFDFSAGLDARIKLDQYDVGLYYSLPFIQTGTLGKLNMDLGLNIRIVDLEASVRGTEQGSGVAIGESKDMTLAIPMLYVGVQVAPVEALAIEAEGRGISVGGNKIYSLTARLRYNAAGPVFVAGGYRYDKVDIDEDDLIVDADFSGPFIEAGIKF